MRGRNIMLRILLVDDEKFAIEGLISMLDWERFQGELSGTASSGEEALKLMESIHPDVIISDIKMKGMDGIELARHVHAKNEQVYMILLTAHGEFEYARQAIQYGVIDYILKPITRDKLEHLNQLLVQKTEQKLLRSKSYLAVWDDSLKDRLLSALKNGSRDTLDEFFQSRLFSELMLGNDCNPVGIQLINYLYQYLADININQEAIAYSRSETMETFLQMSVRQEKMDYIITKYYDLLTSVSLQKSSHTDAITLYAIRYIEEHYTDPEFNLSALSFAMHVSLSHLSTVFKQATGTNLSAYVSELRLEKARCLLSDMHYSISEVSYLSGYADAKYFAKLFKKRMGSTPTEYRNLIIQGGINGN